MKKKLLYLKCKKNLIKTKSGSGSRDVRAFGETVLQRENLIKHQQILLETYKIDINELHPAVKKYAELQNTARVLLNFNRGITNNSELKEESREEKNPLRAIRLNLNNFKNQCNAFHTKLESPADSGNLEYFNQTVEHLLERSRALLARTNDWREIRNYKLVNNQLEKIGLSPFHEVDVTESEGSLSSEQDWIQEVIQEVIQEILEDPQEILEDPQEILEDPQKETGLLSDTPANQTPLVFPSHRQEPTIDFEVQLAICKLVPILRSSGKNSDLFLQPKLILKKNYVGLKLDLHKGTDIQPSVLLNYKQFMLGLKNHQKQPYIVLGKNISINNIPVNFQIKGCLPLTLNKKKLLTNFEGNINATQNFKIQKHINSHFLKNFGLEGKSSINLFSFSKSSLKVFSSSKNNTESKSFFNKSSLDKNLKIVKNLKPTLFIPNGVNLNNTEKNEFFEKREFDLDGYPLRRSLNSINLNEPHLSAQSISVNESNWNNFPQHKNSGGSLVVLTTVGLATSLIFIYRLIEKSFFFKPYDEII
jgi:hypothetical protein